MNEVLERPEIKSIINTVSLNHWNTDYAIRYVVVEISKLVQRDVSFFRMDDDRKLEVLDGLTYQSTYPKIVCKTLHELIRDVLKELGIESHVVVATNTKVPLYALIVEGEHGRYFIDALYDLFRSQYRIQPLTYGDRIHSGTSIINSHDYNLITLPFDYIREMDIGLGLIDREYFSDYIECIKSHFIIQSQARKKFNTFIASDLIPVKMTYISDHLLNLYPVQGTLERVGLYVYFRSNLFNRLERANFVVKRKEDDSIYFDISYAGINYIFDEEQRGHSYSLVRRN